MKGNHAMEKIIYTLIFAGVGGFIGFKLKIPAGALIGAMTFVAIFNICFEKGKIPADLKIIAQTIVGGLIGLNFTRESINGLKELVVPALIIVVGLMISCIIIGILVAKIAGIDPVTALFSSAPGGLTDLALIAEAYGADISKVALLGLARMVTVVAVLPILINWLTRFLHH
jgi:membrane AbrB-like protein